MHVFCSGLLDSSDQVDQFRPDAVHGGGATICPRVLILFFALSHIFIETLSAQSDLSTMYILGMERAGQNAGSGRVGFRRCGLGSD